MEKNRLNVKQFLVMVIFFVILSNAIYCIGDNGKNTSKSPKVLSRQEITLMVDKLFAKKNITEIKTLKHIWELASFVGKDIQLYGRAVTYPRRKNEPVMFYIGGKSLRIRAGYGWLQKKRLPLTKEKNGLISPFILLHGKIIFDYSNMSNEERSNYQTDCDISIGRWDLGFIQIDKVYGSPPLERPADVSLAPPSKSSKKYFNDLFLGLIGDADTVSFARYISKLEKQKRTKIKSNKVDLAENHIIDCSLKKVRFLADLIPFVGSRIEIKGKIVKTGKYGSWIAIGGNDKLLLRANFFAKKDSINKDILISGVLKYEYYTSEIHHRKQKEHKFVPPKEGELCLTVVELEKLLSKEEVNDNSNPCIREVADVITSRLRKSYVTGFAQDADEISFKKFITEMIKEDEGKQKVPISKK
jgi:hypothetical protein